ncbi:MAG: glycosyl hydrolase 115 family protein [Lachnospiraceae bacterium]|nr:glycosyl hydrolase 115 family protein [Lachnospiraceae bacterium]
MNITLFDKKTKTSFYVENSALSGIVKTAAKVVGDFNKVTKASKELIMLDEDDTISSDIAVLFATVDNSLILTELENNGILDFSQIRGKWEVYGQFIVDIPVKKGTVKTLVIAGSDKRGTIYGMYNLSEKMGISPLTYWADSTIPTVETLNIDFPETYVSKEPSVKYRGFFINDEWPCYGNWTMDHFGGFNAEMYEHVFDLLLRLKGNYLWPAMWSSSFAWDGPGLESYELADEYGVVIGNSHHEPCLRAGEEYSHVRGKDSVYGDAWNYHANPQGIERFWKDSLDERAHLESVVTIGMRGEADSTILGADATLKDNIDLLRDVITCQKRLLREQEERLGRKLPTMLALYKEVEPFFYGDETTEGLCGWSELDDTILMLCEDNHGYMRTLPTEEMRNHPAGYGMYYHVDYHGDPISYEWINSTPIKLMRKEMSRAYESGVSSLWILNVGDLKNNEFPLSFFLNMAYDYEKWGKEDLCDKYTKEFMKLHFGNSISEELSDKVADVLTRNVDMLHLRRPEALNSSIYHPCHYYEADRMLSMAENILKDADAIWEELPDEAKDAYYSLIYFQIKAAVNLVKMHLYAGKNALYASQGRKMANDMADQVTLAIERDKAIAKEFGEFKEGKWKGMELAPHIGFTKWNEDGCRYPIRMRVEPIDAPRMFVVRDDEEKVYDKKYGPAMKIVLDDFMYDNRTKVSVTICNTGTGSFNYTITMPENKWFSASLMSGTVSDEETISFYCDKANVPSEGATVVARISDGSTNIDVEARALPNSGKSEITAQKFGYLCLPENVTEGKKNSWKIDVAEDGEYTVETWLFPMNPPKRDGILNYAVTIDGESPVFTNTVPDVYVVGFTKEWADGVLNHRHVCKKTVTLTKGVHELSVLDEGTAIDVLRVMVYNEKQTPMESYLGPQ